MDVREKRKAGISSGAKFKRTARRDLEFPNKEMYFDYGCVAIEFKRNATDDFAERGEEFHGKSSPRRRESTNARVQNLMREIAKRVNVKHVRSAGVQIARARGSQHFQRKFAQG